MLTKRALRVERGTRALVAGLRAADAALERVVHSRRSLRVQLEGAARDLAAAMGEAERAALDYRIAVEKESSARARLNAARDREAAVGSESRTMAQHAAALEAARSDAAAAQGAALAALHASEAATGDLAGVLASLHGEREALLCARDENGASRVEATRKYAEECARAQGVADAAFGLHARCMAMLETIAEDEAGAAGGRADAETRAHVARDCGIADRLYRAALVVVAEVAARHQAAMDAAAAQGAALSDALAAAEQRAARLREQLDAGRARAGDAERAYVGALGRVEDLAAAQADVCLRQASALSAWSRAPDAIGAMEAELHALHGACAAARGSAAEARSRLDACAHMCAVLCASGRAFLGAPSHIHRLAESRARAASLLAETAHELSALDARDDAVTTEGHPAVSGKSATVRPAEAVRDSRVAHEAR